MGFMVSSFFLIYRISWYKKIPVLSFTSSPETENGDCVIAPIIAHLSLVLGVEGMA